MAGPTRNRIALFLLSFPLPRLVADRRRQETPYNGCSPGGGRVKSYRIYIVDPDGRLQLGQAFEATDDGIAGDLAKSFARRGRTAELWEGGRIVGRVSPDGDYTSGG
jgi:hypothetical protein